MFKFLRKYNKWILAVGGTLLMIVFLIPQAINSLSQRAAVSGSQWGVVGADREKVTGEDRLRSEVDLQNLERLGRGVLGLGRLDNPAHWYLLVREAEAAGLVGGAGSIALPEEQRDQVRAILGSSGMETLARLDGVERLIGLYASAPKLSDRRLHAKAREEFYGVDTRLVVLEADEANEPMPSEAEIQAHFEEYRDVERGAGEHGFGYRFPDRVKLEWLEISADDVRASIEGTDVVDDVALLRHWQQAPPEKGFPTIERGAEIPDVVREDLLRTLTTERLDDIANFATDQFKTTWRPLPTTTAGYYVLPENWAEQRIELPSLAELIRDEFEGLALPTYESPGKWLSVAELADLGDVSAAQTRAFGNRPLGLAQTVPALKEFNVEDASILLQTGVAGPALRAASDRSVYLFRILAADPAHPPQSVDEVRDEIVTDLRRLADFNALVARADALREAAVDRGLLSLAFEHDTAVQPLTRVSEFEPGQVNLWLRFNFRAPTEPLPVIGSDEQATQAIIDFALSRPGTGSLGELSRDERTFFVPVEKKLAVLVGEILQEYPLSREQYMTVTGYQDRLQVLVLGEEQIEGYNIQDVFGYETLVARNQFEFTRAEEDEDDALPADAAAAAE